MRSVRIVEHQEKNAMSAKCTDNSNETIKEIVDCVVELRVTNSTEVIKQSIQNAVKGQSDEINENVERLVHSQNAVIGTINVFSKQIANETEAAQEVRDSISDEIHTIVDQVQKTNKRAQHSEHISYVTRGKLGAQERKRRKVDLEEISRLRNEIGVLKRQNRDKDNMIKALADDVNDIKAMMKIMLDQQNQH